MVTMTHPDAQSLVRRFGLEGDDADVIVAFLTRTDLVGALEALAGPADQTRFVEPGFGRRPLVRDVVEIYRILLSRPIESGEALAEALARKDLATLIRSIVFSAEMSGELIERDTLARLKPGARREDFARKTKDVLLFGAYGNGNVGDTEQASALAYLVEGSGVSVERVSATSWLDVSDYPFPGRKLGSREIANYDLLKETKLLIMGGGGLLGSTHFPLDRTEWRAALQAAGLPYALWGVGASPEHLSDPVWIDAYRALVQGAVLVGGRDEEADRALGLFRDDVVPAIDPILHRAIERVGGSSVRHNRHGKICFILKGPTSADEAAVIDHVQSAYGARHDDHEFVFIEPRFAPEQALMRRFPNALAFDDYAALTRHLTQARLVVSMRMHGVVCAIEARTPVIGLCHKKIRDVMGIMRLGDQFLGADVAALDGALADPGRWRGAEIDSDLVESCAAAKERLHACIRQAIG